MAFNDKKLAYALRHHPEQFGLKLDDEGWTDLQNFLDVMGITREKLDHIIQNMDKQRIQIKDGKIRFGYGHSFANKIKQKETEPPDTLYHGTTPFSAFVIKKEGLKPMNRQYVHLSTTQNTATLVGKRRDPNPTILTINAKKAFLDGVKFYHSNEDVWLADYIAPEYIS